MWTKFKDQPPTREQLDDVTSELIVSDGSVAQAAFEYSGKYYSIRTSEVIEDVEEWVIVRPNIYNLS